MKHQAGIQNSIIEELFFKVESDTTKLRAYQNLVVQNSDQARGSATAMASRAVKRFVEQALENEILWRDQ